MAKQRKLLSVEAHIIGRPEVAHPLTEVRANGSPDLAGLNMDARDADQAERRWVIDWPAVVEVVPNDGELPITALPLTVLLESADIVHLFASLQAAGWSAEA